MFQHTSYVNIIFLKSAESIIWIYWVYLKIKLFKISGGKLDIGNVKPW